MDWTQFLILGSGLLASFWKMHKENQQLRMEFNEESKAFHGRLCALEEKYIQMMQKSFESRNSK